MWFREEIKGEYSVSLSYLKQLLAPAKDDVRALPLRPPWPLLRCVMKTPDTVCGLARRMSRRGGCAEPETLWRRLGQRCQS